MSDASDQVGDLAKATGMEVVDGDGAPVVTIAKDLNQTAKLLGQVVGRLDLFFLNGDMVFFDHSGEMRVMTGRVFRTWINEFVVMAERYDRQTGQAVRTTLDQTDAATIIESENFRRGVRRIRWVNQVRLPVLRKRPAGSGELLDDGWKRVGDQEVRLELLPWGYDEQYEVFTVKGEYSVDYEGGMDVAAARGWLERTFRHFPFSDERSRAVMMAAMLALYVKHLPGGSGLRPGFLWLANKAESGKSLLAKAAQYPVLGRAPAVKMKRGEELDKEMEAFSRSAVPAIFLDNVYGGIQSATLDQMLTSEEGAGRAMGGHGTFIARFLALLLVTGNKLELNDDAARRFLVVDLFEKGNPLERGVSAEERLSDTKMKGKLWRARMLEVLHALVMNWVERGMPKAKVLLGSFEEYAELLGGIVAAAGYEEPFQRAVIPDAISPERAEFAELLSLVVAAMEEKQEMDFTLEELCRLARSAAIFTDKVGTEDEGRRLTVKQDGLRGELAAHAMDNGYMTPSQRSSWGKRMQAEVGTEPRSKCGRRVEFGKRLQSRKATYTVKLLDG
jgi:hypothetical protein